MIYLLCLILGVTAGLRAATPLAALCWGAFFGWIDLDGTWAAFAGNIITAIVLTIIAVLEYVGDQLPNTPSRKQPPSFAGRVVAGALAGAVLGLPLGAWIAGLVLGAIGAVLGTLGGFEARRRLAAAFAQDRPAAFVEDAIAIVVALLAVYLA